VLGPAAAREQLTLFARGRRSAFTTAATTAAPAEAAAFAGFAAFGTRLFG
jgi:hypothetical protein